jgi:hypothetical protein
LGHEKELTGTWVKSGADPLVFNSSIFSGGSEFLNWMMKGFSLTYDGSNLTLISMGTGFPKGQKWEGKAEITGNTLTLSGFTGDDAVANKINGEWTKQQ